ncbi:MAG TPA: hypothetical protein PKB07_03920 [Flavilitoribacter sp.]|nr:hypothetical protein [Flavilitoribacter sp.]
MVELLQRPWPWYLAGFMIGLLVPALLLLGNKKFGISSSFRDICAACVPAGLSFFKYDWRDNLWNIFFLTRNRSHNRIMLDSHLGLVASLKRRTPQEREKRGAYDKS